MTTEASCALPLSAVEPRERDLAGSRLDSVQPRETLGVERAIPHRAVGQLDGIALVRNRPAALIHELDLDPGQLGLGRDGSLFRGLFLVLPRLSPGTDGPGRAHERHRPAQ